MLLQPETEQHISSGSVRLPGLCVKITPCTAHAARHKGTLLGQVPSSIMLLWQKYLMMHCTSTFVLPWLPRGDGADMAVGGCTLHSILMYFS